MQETVTTDETTQDPDQPMYDGPEAVGAEDTDAPYEEQPETEPETEALPEDDNQDDTNPEPDESVDE